MQEHGISKIVSVKFQETEREEDAARGHTAKPVDSRRRVTKSKAALKPGDESDVISMGK